MAVKGKVKYWIQRRTRGWDDAETWNLDWEFIKWINSRFKRYKELASKVIDLEYNKFKYKKKTYTQLELIDRVIELSDDLLENYWLYDKNYNHQEKIDELLDIFKLIIRSMWW